VAVTSKGRSITMTADADTVAGVFFISGMTFQVAGGVAGERLLVTDTGGSILADYLVTDTTADNADLWNGREPMHANGILVETFPTGTAVLTIFLE
jgi:predicted proteasome-type protease